MIRLVILEQDEIARRRLKAALERKYADAFELYGFSDRDAALQKVCGKDRIDILLAGEEFGVEESEVPARTAVVWLTEFAADLQGSHYAVERYQKTSLIYQKLVEISNEHGAQAVQRDETKAMVIAFGSASGGVGSSTMAAACAVHFAGKGKRVLYLNLETFSSAELFFDNKGEKLAGMTDVISALSMTSKPAMAALPGKLEKWVLQDPASGVFYYAKAENAVNMSELTGEAVIQLLELLSEKYDYIILDADFGVDQKTLTIYKQAHSIMLVSDGSDVSNKKTDCAYWALEERDKTEDYPLTKRISILYNRIVNKSGKSIYGLPKVGEVRLYGEGSARDIVDRIAKKDFFDNI